MNKQSLSETNLGAVKASDSLKVFNLGSLSSLGILQVLSI